MVGSRRAPFVIHRARRYHRPPMPQSILDKIDRREAVVGVIGLGYVGLPLSGVFVSAGFRTIGLDIDPEKIRHIAARKNYLQHLGEHYVRDLVVSGRFEATDQFDRLGGLQNDLLAPGTRSRAGGYLIKEGAQFDRLQVDELAGLQAG